jgi:tRNA-dihydrouridine synthase
MIGRGAYGRPWIAASIEQALRTGEAMREPAHQDRLHIVLDHLRDSLRFYGDALGLRVFRKHLGWYVETGLTTLAVEARRAAKSALCRLETADQVEWHLISLWRGCPELAACDS